MRVGGGGWLLSVVCAVLSVLSVFSTSSNAELREFTLTVDEGTLDLNGTRFAIWTYNGRFPGPEIRVKEGDTARIKLRNKSGAKHGLFFHGLRIPNTVALQEQVPVDPGYEYVYEFVAKPAGTHLYHCSWNMNEHLGRGLFGAFIVEAKDEERFDREFVYVLSDWSSKVAKGESEHETGHPRTILDHDITAINNRAVTGNDPIIMEVKKAERIKIRFASMGHLPHRLRFPSGVLVTHQNGYPVSPPSIQDQFTIYPGSRYDIVITAKETGRWPVYHRIELPRPLGRDDGDTVHGSGHGSHGGHDVQERKLKQKEAIALVLEVKR